MVLCPDKSKRFYDLVSSRSIDGRDNRGKRHTLAVVLTGVVMAVMSVQDGSLSALHRHMQQYYKALCANLGVEEKRVVSRAQLPLILNKVRFNELSNLIYEYFGYELSSAQSHWFSVDGKDLRGSHELHQTRGESVVEVIRHSDGRAFAQAYYSGNKDSEIVAVRTLLKDSAMEKQQLTLDALHCNEDTTKQIHEAGGTYLTGVKDNQALLQADLQQWAKTHTQFAHFEDFTKAHGRIEERFYKAWDIRNVFFEERWDKSGIATLIEVNRKTFKINTQKETNELCLLISNKPILSTTDAQILFNAVRNHWSIEVNNWIRDVNMKEDDAHSRKKGLQRTMAAIRTIALNAIRATKPPCIKVLMEDCNRNFNLAIRTLRDIQFL